MAFTGWVWLDIAAALLVTILIGKAAWEILQQTGRVLVDTAPYSSEELKHIIDDISPDIIRARSRGSLDAAHIDIDLQVPPEMTTEQNNSIAYAIRRRIGEKLEGIAEIEVHFVPHHANGRNPILTARAYADARGLSTHEVQMSYDSRGCVLEMHVEVPAQQSLVEAHEQVSLLEADVSEALPEVDRVVTHIEPQQAPLAANTAKIAMERCEEIHVQVQNLLQQYYPKVGWHDLAVRAEQYGFALNLHATLPAEMSVEAAHNLAENAESLLRVQQPLLSRVTIHTEPFDHE
jgi:divalent metal cation (Fe/Co/Zn/Cd) transporter